MGTLSPFNTPNPSKAQVKLKSNKKGSLIKEGFKISVLRFEARKAAEGTQSSPTCNPREGLALPGDVPTAAQMLFLNCTSHLSEQFKSVILSSKANTFRSQVLTADSPNERKENLPLNTQQKETS